MTGIATQPLQAAFSPGLGTLPVRGLTKLQGTLTRAELPQDEGTFLHSQRYPLSAERRWLRSLTVSKMLVSSMKQDC